jgi:uncharacterized protein (DUF58 family)
VSHQSLRPAAARSAGRSASKFPFAAASRTYMLLGAGLIFIALMFLSRAFGYALLAWNLIVLVLWAMDLARLPHPASLEVERTFCGPLAQLDSSEVELQIINRSPRIVRLTLRDDVPEGISPEAAHVTATVGPKAEVSTHYTLVPQHRGEHHYGQVHARVESALRLAQRWIVFDLRQSVKVYPNLKGTADQEVMLTRSRQIEMQQRLLRQRGHGREFESLRDFQTGDEWRNICWTASARRGRLVSTMRQTERSQTIVSVLDCGRLMRARMNRKSKLDYATETALRLAQLASYSGDNSAMLAYGSQVQQRLMAGKGEHHLRALLEQLALVREQPGEADHLRAAAALQGMQKRRAMIVWITDIADLSITPEVVAAALQASRRHLVVMAVLGQPDVRTLVAQPPADNTSLFRFAAASETIGRRELILSQLQSQGVHVIEVDAPELTGAVLNKYLEVKQRSLL